MRSLPAEYRPEPSSRELLGYVHLICAGLMTAASALVIVIEPVKGTGAVLFFGSTLALAGAQLPARLDDRARARVEPFLRRLDRRNVDGYSWLLRVLADMDGRSPRARRRSRVALDAIAANGYLMEGLFVHARRRQISVAVFGDRLGRFGTGRLVPVLASLHPDGRIREAAVTAMARRLRPAHLPFLVERAVDWVPEVRTAAHDVLRTQLGLRPELVPAARSAYARVARRKHAPALAQLLDGF